MRYILIIAVLIIFLIISQGCIRNISEIENENCNNYLTSSARVSCYKAKANFYAAAGNLEKAVQECENVMKEVGECKISPTFTLDYNKIKSANAYATCIQNVAYYSGKKEYTDASGNKVNVCKKIQSKCNTQLYTIIFNIGRKIIEGAYDLATGQGFQNIAKTQTDIEVERCEKLADKSSNLDDNIKQNYKYIFGFSVP